VGEDSANNLFSSVQNAVFDALSMEACYLPFSVKSEDLKSSVEILRESFAGFNVAAPYQYDIIKYMDVLDDSAKSSGVVNTVKCAKGKLYGYNTQTGAVLESLSKENIKFYDKDILIIGAGGMAKSIAHALLGEGAFITIVSMDFAQSSALQQELQKSYNKNRVRALKGVLPPESFFAIFDAASTDLEARFAQNALLEETIKEASFIYEILCPAGYFEKKARELGIQYQNGRETLVLSALSSQKIWLGDETFSRINEEAINNIKALSC
jgi:shikimate dehydrogenase